MLLSLFTLAAALPAAAQNSKKHKVLFVLTSHDQLGNTGKKTGFWIEEFATPYYYFTDQGVEVTVATPNGGQAPIDPKSSEPDYQTDATRRYFSDKSTQKLLSRTVKLSQINTADYDAVFYPGGHGPMWDLANDTYSIALINAFYAQGKPLAFVCHGSAALVNVKDASGNYLVNGKQVTGFCNTEEEAVQLTQVVPFPLETRLKERGADYRKGADWSSFTVTDGLLVTGQNPQSSLDVATTLLNMIRQ